MIPRSKSRGVVLTTSRNFMGVASTVAISHDLSPFFARRHPASLVVDACCRFGPRADATLWSGVEPGISGWFRLKLRYYFSLWYCFSLPSFCFPHERYTRRDGGGYLSICGHICHLFAHVRPPWTPAIDIFETEHQLVVKGICRM
jgi:hypothetical protein